jgi:hypothetical protein
MEINFESVSEFISIALKNLKNTVGIILKICITIL